ncbi:bile acid:sodium symporter family protein [Bythopirellula polymerisocia]|uniref:Sodium Bile acid symporter family protein n=1 Tax=Bythopirellula polymerisocia TaxID=2528003 RepID=A0A5C6CVK6_9BACT|nr:bile acid:sodium symporter family protein [Bythopirellula polymerisocia]TWU27704.1 Sodium Bile acid symporter family protein [Bythopirellula polymerisocia]
MATANKLFLGIAVLALLFVLVGVFCASATLWHPAAVVFAVATALGFGAFPQLSGYRFTLWILAAVVSAMIYPNFFLSLGPFDFKFFQVSAIDLQNKWLFLIIIQLVMFGMGTKMSFKDFAGVAKMPYPVIIGVGLQFLVMPLLGYSLAKLFAFPPEIAAGVVLIGSCSSGLASNVMCFLAGANLALSITLTAVATLFAPLATTFWMQMLAGEFVEIDSRAMLLEIVKIVLVPIGAAMLHDYLKHSSVQKKRIVVSLALICAGIIILLLLKDYQAFESFDFPISTPVFEAILMTCGAVAFGVAYHFVASRFPSIDRNIHLISMFGIIYFTAVTTAAGRDNLLVAGMALILAAIIHNLAGYGLGYSLSRLAGLDKNSALTVAFEVGMQNGGMASGLARFMGKLGTVGLAAAVFSPWMNISGSILAMQVRRHRLSKTDNNDRSENSSD